MRQPRSSFLRVREAVEARPRPTQVPAARETQREGAARVPVSELAQVVGCAFQDRVMLQLFVAQRRRDSSQGGRARGALATTPQ